MVQKAKIISEETRAPTSHAYWSTYQNYFGHLSGPQLRGAEGEAPLAAILPL